MTQHKIDAEILEFMKDAWNKGLKPSQVPLPFKWLQTTRQIINLSHILAKRGFLKSTLQQRVSALKAEAQNAQNMQNMQNMQTQMQTIKPPSVVFRPRMTGTKTLGKKNKLNDADVQEIVRLNSVGPCVYRIRNISTGDAYVGSTHQLGRRVYEHRIYKKTRTLGKMGFDFMRPDLWNVDVVSTHATLADARLAENAILKSRSDCALNGQKACANGSRGSKLRRDQDRNLLLQMWNEGYHVDEISAKTGYSNVGVTVSFWRKEGYPFLSGQARAQVRRARVKLLKAGLLKENI